MHCGLPFENTHVEPFLHTTSEQKSTVPSTMKNNTQNVTLLCLSYHFTNRILWTGLSFRTLMFHED